MSSIGKIFLLINFGLAFGFLFWASTAVATNAKWKDQYEAELAAHQSTEASFKEDLSGLQIDLNNERDAKDARASERDQATAEATRNREELDAAKRANEQLRADVAAIKESLDAYLQQNQALEAAKDAAVAEARELERECDSASQASDDSEQARADAEEALREAQAQIASLERNVNTFKGEVSQLEAQVAAAVQSGFTIDNPQVDIDARVLNVDTSITPGLVALNVGANSGVKRGMTFQVYSGSSYKGYVRVETVRENMCSALIVAQVEGASIGQGDSASTNL
jgi:hypothetical protein